MKSTRTDGSHAAAKRRAGSLAKPAEGRFSVVLRGRLWIDIGSTPALTEAGADLLAQIEACGSLSEAARRLRFSYRRAWLLSDSMNRLWPEPLVHSAIGGTRGGGTRVTELGHEVLAAYRDLQLQLEHLLDQASDSFKAATRTNTK